MEKIQTLFQDIIFGLKEAILMPGYHIDSISCNKEEITLQGNPIIQIQIPMDIPVIRIMTHNKKDIYFVQLNPYIDSYNCELFLNAGFNEHGIHLMCKLFADIFYKNISVKFPNNCTLKYSPITDLEEIKTMYLYDR